MEKTLEEYRRLLPAAEKYTYMNSAGCGPLPLPVLERMEGVFRRMALEGQVNVEIHGWLKEMLEEIDLGGGALLDIGIYNLGFLHMVMGQAPVSFESNVHMSEYGTDDFSAVSLTYPGGRSAHAVQAIGMDLGRAAAVFGTRGAIWLPDFQMARTMTVTPYGGQPYEMSLPWEINGFEYQIDLKRFLHEYN